MLYGFLNLYLPKAFSTANVVMNYDTDHLALSGHGTQSWQMIHFQRVMGTILVNAYLALKYFEEKSTIRLSCFTIYVMYHKGSRYMHHN